MKNRLLVFMFMMVAFCIAAEYAISRPVSSSLFLSYFSSQAIPYAWLLMVPLNFFIVSFYNKWIGKLGPLKMVLLSSFCVMGMSLLTCLYPRLSFFHYIWKDIYVLLMFKQLWSLIHTSLDTKKKTYLYALAFGVGGGGAILGSLVPSFLAMKAGSHTLLLFTLPLYLLLIGFYTGAYRLSSQKKLFLDPTPPKFSSFFKEKYLVYLLLLVLFMQISASLIDYQFNTYIESFIPILDERTAYLGKVFSLINVTTTLFQIAGGFLLIRLLGQKRSHFLIPGFLLINTLLFILYPSFTLITLSFIAVKAIDHSLFGIMREMLYSPLSVDQKFRAKALIDVFAYRSSKAIASLFLLVIQMTYFPFSPFISLCGIGIFITWLFLIPRLFKSQELLDF